MPRMPRIFIRNQPQHVVVRGHNRDPVFAHHDDFRTFYRYLREASSKHTLSIHAWVLMHNHIHLLVTPAISDSLPKTMQSVGRRYSQYFNRRYHRSGSLWEGRYKTGFVDTESYLLTCYRYIEMNPVRAGIAMNPEDYPYSSYHANALGKHDALITPHSVYEEYINSGRTAYIDLFMHEMSRKELIDIRRGTEKGLGIGKTEFLLKLAKLNSGVESLRCQSRLTQT